VDSICSFLIKLQPNYDNMKHLCRVLTVILLSALSNFVEAGEVTVKTGLEVLRDHGFAELEGKRVALLTNPSGVDRNIKSTVDILYEAENVNLVRLFGPEHGVRGDVYAGANADDSIDPKTGLKVYSLYGKYRQPTHEMLDGVDVVVYDIQDVGTRCYTFISTLGLMMRACAECGVEVMVLDRPNPLGGRKVEGCCVEPGFASFVGQYAIPFVYGLTVGELASLLNEEGLNRGEKGDKEPVKCKLSVIPMEGWTRDMTFSETGLPWVITSPQIPDVENAMAYPCSGIAGDYSATLLNVGVGYTLPFQTFAAQWVDADKLKSLLDSYCIPGVAFRQIHYTPLFGASQGVLLHGVQFFFTDYESAPLSLISFYVMQAVHELYPDRAIYGTDADSMHKKICGTDKIMNLFGKNYKVSEMIDYWNKDVKTFIETSNKYYIY